MRPFLASTVLCTTSLFFSGCSASTPQQQAITLAVPLPYTGDLESFGFTLEHTVYLAAEQVNAAGGILGAPLKIVAYDTHSDVNHGYGIIRQVLEDGPFAIIGPNSTALVPPLEPAASQQGILLITPGETYPVGGQPYPITQPLWAQLNPSIGPIAATLSTTLVTAKAQTIAFCYVNDTYGSSYLTAFKNAFEPSGGSIESYQFSPNVPVPSASISEIIALKPDAVVLIAAPSVAADIVNSIYLQSQSLALTAPPFYFGPTLQNSVFTRSVIPQAFGTSYGFAPPTSDPTNAFPQMFAARWYGGTAITDAFYYYDAILFFAAHAQAAARDAGDTLPTPAQVYARMLSPPADAPTIAWQDIGTFLKTVQAGDTFVYGGVTGINRLGSDGVRTQAQAYVPASWTP